MNGWDWKLLFAKSNFQSQPLNKKILKRSKRLKLKCKKKKTCEGSSVIAWCNSNCTWSKSEIYYKCFIAIFCRVGF